MIADGFGLWRKTNCLDVEIGNQSPLRDRQHSISRTDSPIRGADEKERTAVSRWEAQEELNFTCIPTNYFRASIAARNLHLLPASRNSTHKKVSRTSRIVARIAGRLARPAAHRAANVVSAANVRCSARRAAHAEDRLKCRSSRAAISRSTAGIASRSNARTNHTHAHNVAADLLDPPPGGD